VLPTPQAAALVARQEKGKLPGISSAERENNRLERRQQKKLSAEDASEQRKLDDEERRELQKKMDSEQKMLQKNSNKERNKQDLYKREGFSN